MAEQTKGREHESQAGFTLIELLVSMGLFAVLLVVMMGAITAMTVDLRKANGVSIASDQARRAFERLDKQVRYADAISTPGTVGSDSYVEFRTTDAAGQQLCRQWRLVAGSDLLQQRSWLAGTTPASPPAWKTVSVGVANLSTQPPFTLQAPTTARPYQQLTVDVVVTSGSKPVGRAEIETVFAARNTNSSTSTSVCNQVARS